MDLGQVQPFTLTEVPLTSSTDGYASSPSARIAEEYMRRCSPTPPLSYAPSSPLQLHDFLALDATLGHADIELAGQSQKAKLLTDIVKPPPFLRRSEGGEQPFIPSSRKDSISSAAFSPEPQSLNQAALSFWLDSPESAAGPSTPSTSPIHKWTYGVGSATRLNNRHSYDFPSPRTPSSPVSARGDYVEWAGLSEKSAKLLGIAYAPSQFATSFEAKMHEPDLVSRPFFPCSRESLDRIALLADRLQKWRPPSKHFAFVRHRAWQDRDMVLTALLNPSDPGCCSPDDLMFSSNLQKEVLEYGARFAAIHSFHPHFTSEDQRLVLMPKSVVYVCDLETSNAPRVGSIWRLKVTGVEYAQPHHTLVRRSRLRHEEQVGNPVGHDAEWTIQLPNLEARKHWHALIQCLIGALKKAEENFRNGHSPPAGLGGFLTKSRTQGRLEDPAKVVTEVIRSRSLSLSQAPDLSELKAGARDYGKPQKRRPGTSGGLMTRSEHGCSRRPAPRPPRMAHSVPLPFPATQGAAMLRRESSPAYITPEICPWEEPDAKPDPVSHTHTVETFVPASSASLSTPALTSTPNRSSRRRVSSLLRRLRRDRHRQRESQGGKAAASSGGSVSESDHGSSLRNMGFSGASTPASLLDKPLPRVVDRRPSEPGLGSNISPSVDPHYTHTEGEAHESIRDSLDGQENGSALCRRRSDTGREYARKVGAASRHPNAQRQSVQGLGLAFDDSEDGVSESRTSLCEPAPVPEPVAKDPIDDRADMQQLRRPRTAHPLDASRRNLGVEASLGPPSASPQAAKRRPYSSGGRPPVTRTARSNSSAAGPPMQLQRRQSTDPFGTSAERPLPPQRPPPPPGMALPPLPDQVKSSRPTTAPGRSADRSLPQGRRSMNLLSRPSEMSSDSDRSSGSPQKPQPVVQAEDRFQTLPHRQSWHPIGRSSYEATHAPPVQVIMPPLSPSSPLTMSDVHSVVTHRDLTLRTSRGQDPESWAARPTSRRGLPRSKGAEAQGESGRRFSRTAEAQDAASSLASAESQRLRRPSTSGGASPQMPEKPCPSTWRRPATAQDSTFPASSKTQSLSWRRMAAHRGQSDTSGLNPAGHLSEPAPSTRLWKTHSARSSYETAVSGSAQGKAEEVESRRPFTPAELEADALAAHRMRKLSIASTASSCTAVQEKPRPAPRPSSRSSLRISRPPSACSIGSVGGGGLNMEYSKRPSWDCSDRSAFLHSQDPSPTSQNKQDARPPSFPREGPEQALLSGSPRARLSLDARRTSLDEGQGQVLLMPPRRTHRHGNDTPLSADEIEVVVSPAVSEEITRFPSSAGSGPSRTPKSGGGTEGKRSSFSLSSSSTSRSAPPHGRAGASNGAAWGDDGELDSDADTDGDRDFYLDIETDAEGGGSAASAPRSAPSRTRTHAPLASRQRRSGSGSGSAGGVAAGGAGAGAGGSMRFPVPPPRRSASQPQLHLQSDAELQSLVRAHAQAQAQSHEQHQAQPQAQAQAQGQVQVQVHTPSPGRNRGPPPVSLRWDFTATTTKEAVRVWEARSRRRGERTVSLSVSARPRTEGGY